MAEQPSVRAWQLELGSHPAPRLAATLCVPRRRVPTEEEADRILRSRPGFFASLTPEQIAAMDAYDGPEVLGSPNGPKRTF